MYLKTMSLLMSPLVRVSILQGILLAAMCNAWKVRLPQRVHALESSCVVIPCRAIPYDSAYWYQYDSIKYLKVYDKNDPGGVIDQFKSRTSLVGNKTTGDCSLRISNIKQSDNSLCLYVWIYPDKDHDVKFYHTTVQLSVTGIPNIPRIDQSGPLIEGNISLKCEVNHTCPSVPPMFKWNHSKGLRLIPEPPTQVEVEEGKWRSASVLHLTSTYSDNGVDITCEATYSEVKKVKETIKLNVQYGPRDVNVSFSGGRAKEGDRTKLSCVSDGNPAPHIFQWYRVNGNQIYDLNHHGQYIELNLSRTDIYTCTAQNSLGNATSKALPIPIEYAPDILPESYCTLSGGMVTCLCVVDANPSSDIIWNISRKSNTEGFNISQTEQDNIVSGKLIGGMMTQDNIFCIAFNAHGRISRQLPFTVTGSIETKMNIVFGGMAAFAAMIIIGLGLTVFKKIQNMKKENGQKNKTLSLSEMRQDGTQREGGSEYVDSTGLNRRLKEKNPEDEVMKGSDWKIENNKDEQEEESVYLEPDCCRDDTGSVYANDMCFRRD
ncbi:B-cell receptor CD22-like [Lepisosteus oculatus]|uniref:B-cell receptor CD22-like n=1 Tax=Lepisosteus oculatus TaxID=7918 RepID=UPI00371A44F8